MPYVLPPAPKPKRQVTTRHIAWCYLPTIGLWSLIRAVRFYRLHRSG